MDLIQSRQHRHQRRQIQRRLKIKTTTEFQSWRATFTNWRNSTKDRKMQLADWNQGSIQDF
jgi:hypothetical protein